MRRRRHQRGGSVLVVSFGASILLNAIVGFPLKELLENFLSHPDRGAPVRVVSLTAEQWARNRRTASGVHRPPPTSANRAEEARRAPEVKKPEEKKPEEKKDDKLRGQVVEVAPTQDDSPNPEATRLSKYNTHAKKESVARLEERDPNMKRVTNKLQKVDQQPAQQAVQTPNLIMKGDGLDSDRDGAQSETGKPTEQKKQKFVIEVPRLEQRDQVKLKLGEGDGIGQHVNNRNGSETLKGNADAWNLQMGSGPDAKGSEASGGKKGPTSGSDKKPLPTLSALMPTFGSLAKISGSPSNDYVEGVPEGDGTFLNTKEFKYATFFYRVRDSVASFWVDLASSEYRRRDPTGNIYGVRDRATLLKVQLNRDGGLADVRVEQSSGVDFLDHVAVEAFRKAEPFPNPPAGIADEDGNIRFNFQFVVTMRPRGPLDLFQMR